LCADANANARHTALVRNSISARNAPNVTTLVRNPLSSIPKKVKGKGKEKKVGEPGVQKVL